MRRALTILLAVLLLCVPVLAADEHAEDGHSNVTLWKAVNFALLFGALYWVLRKPARKYFASRSVEIREGIEEANQARKEAEERAAEMERRLANLEQEIEKLRESARQEMAAENVRLQTETERSMARMQAAAEQEIASASNQARKQLRAHSAELAMELAREKVRERMTPEVADSLMTAFASDLGNTSQEVN
ncbi:MAG: ATP synthase F0 subunit B [bacterium]|nr:ATP synthase F0 subunit B [bacterium]